MIMNIFQLLQSNGMESCDLKQGEMKEIYSEYIFLSTTENLLICP